MLSVFLAWTPRYHHVIIGDFSTAIPMRARGDHRRRHGVRTTLLACLYRLYCDIGIRTATAKLLRTQHVAIRAS
ncbi:hypothetical protein DPMN_004531 [Dreissena polymorpha]|uniref:Uncharacterized protein n=1 Tax=Dreissena polymorpha TaxID=45954 RepID=A0A9D4MMZ8_DREPO|nr:hypothetical protein DPMN_004531 [Dreissena polymorpha]